MLSFLCFLVFLCLLKLLSQFVIFPSVSCLFSYVSADLSVARINATFGTKTLQTSPNKGKYTSQSLQIKVNTPHKTKVNIPHKTKVNTPHKTKANAPHNLCKQRRLRRKNPNQVAAVEKVQWTKKMEKTQQTKHVFSKKKKASGKKE